MLLLTRCILLPLLAISDEGISTQKLIGALGLYRGFDSLLHCHWTSRRRRTEVAREQIEQVKGHPRPDDGWC